MPTFNNEASLRAFPGFQLLSDHIQSIVLQMLKDDRLNSYGSLKRPPNAWLIFRSDMLASSPEMSSIPQAQVTVQCKSRWAVATLQERVELQARSRRANDELLQYFPDYSYKPMSTGEKKRWKELGAYQRKDFWLSSALRIAERIANPGKPWDGFLTLEKWAKGHAPAGSLDTSNNTSLVVDFVQPPEPGRASQSTSPPPARIASRSQQICMYAINSRTYQAINLAVTPSGAPNTATDPLSTTASRFHPYGKKARTHGSPAESREKEQAGIRRKAAKKTLPPGNKMVWVSEEVDDDVPDDVFKHLSSSMSPDEASPDHLVLGDYTDPWTPGAMDEHGEQFYPEIGSISEYHEYMSAYYFAQENSLNFIWPPPPRSPSPSLSPSSPHESLVDSTIPLVQVAERIPPDFQSSNSLEGSDFSTETPPPEMCEPVPGTDLISDSDSDSESVTTPEEELDWGESVSFDGMEDLDHEGLEGFEFDFE
ncbi:hypothetical protein RSAG8_09480, partial [Rhizoctonia solani AG-8 WAC10335]